MTRARYLVITDLETSGLIPGTHEILQVARVVVDSQEKCILSYTSMDEYVIPIRWRARSQEAMDVNHLTLQKLTTDGIVIDAAMDQFVKGVNWHEAVLASWGIDFELKFLTRAFEERQRPVPFVFKGFDVRSAVHMVRAMAGETQYLGLGEACDWFGVPFDVKLAHDAGYDAARTAELVVKLLRGERYSA